MTNERKDDEEEARRAADAIGAATMIDRHRGALLAFIDRQLGHKLRAKLEPEDVLQEVSAEVVKVAANTRLDGERAFSWLCQMAERKIIDLHRRHFEAKKRDGGREVSLQAPVGGQSGTSGPAQLACVLEASVTSPSEAFNRQERVEKLNDAVAVLNDDMREALRLRYEHNLPSKEIAERMGKSDAAVRVLLSRAVRKLQDALGDSGTFPGVPHED